MIEGRRVGRVVPAGLSLLAVAALVATAMLATGSASPAVAFQQTGHWVFNRAESTVAHVDGGTRQVDARIKIPNAGPDQLFAVQGEKQGFLVGARTITVFGKSTLTVDGTIPAAGPELPTGIEVIGGPYLVYRQTGVIVRLGDPPLSVRAGGPVDRPTYTDDGTVWVHRPDTGAVCALRRGADTLDCPRSTAASLPGALAVTTAAASYLDTADDAGQVVDGTGPAAATALGTDLPDTALIGDRDTRGRLPSVVTGANRLVLADSSGIPTGVAGGAPISIDLGPGTFSAPMAADGIVAVVDETHHLLLTFDLTGRRLGSADLPPDGTATLSRGGDGRIYLDGAGGATTYVVGADGKATPVRTGGATAAVTAPPQDVVRPVPPPRSRDNPVPAPGRGSLPVPPSAHNDPATNPTTTPVAPRPVAPLPPVGVRAGVGANGAVTVSWQPGNDAPGVTYTVHPSGGAPAQTTTRTSASFEALTPGSTYTFTASASNAAGTSAESDPSAPVTVPVGAPGAPVGLTVTKDYWEGNTGLTKDVGAAWSPPPLNGGELVKYVMRLYDRNGGTNERMVTETTTTTARIINGYACLTPFQVRVWAVTRAPGSTKEITGPPATVQTKEVTDCTAAWTATATVTGPDEATVRFTKTSGRMYVYWPCTLTFNGVTRWTGSCSQTTAPVVVDGLMGGATYSIVLKVKQATTTTTSTSTLYVPDG